MQTVTTRRQLAGQAHSVPADLFLPRLTNVRQRGPGSWVSCCPAHEDRSPSLSIRELADSTLLIKCFAGCSALTIVNAVGLELRDLFPQPAKENYGDRQAIPRPPPFPWRDAIKSLAHHLKVVQIGAARLAAGDELSEQDLDAMNRAAVAVYELLEEVRS